jgi:hypothetical protein
VLDRDERHEDVREECHGDEEQYMRTSGATSYLETFTPRILWSPAWFPLLAGFGVLVAAPWEGAWGFRRAREAAASPIEAGSPDRGSP